MANTLTPIDVYQIVNQLADQALGGANNLKATDTSSFVSVGELILRTGTENVMNALSTVLARTIFSVRPYTSPLSSIRVSEQRWGGQIRKVTYLYSGSEASQDMNTDLNPNQLANGNSIDMYKINNPEALQLNFYGTKKLQKHITRYRDALSLAFSSETEFIRFLDGVMVEFNNEVEVANEQETRATILNFMAGMIDMGLEVVDLIELYNTENGTTYTRGQLLTAHMTEFMQFFAAEVKIRSKKLRNMSFNHHANITGKKPIPRHTPQSRQKMLMYDPLFIKAETKVYTSIFNPQYLNIGTFEGVDYWQSQNNPTAISITPNILDVATGASKNGNPVEADYIVGLLYDEEALGIIPQFDYASTTPFNSAGGYYNMFLHWRFNSYNDFTENAILFILGEGGAGQIDYTDVNIARINNNTVAGLHLPVNITDVNYTGVSNAVPVKIAAGPGLNTPVKVSVTAAASEADEPVTIPEIQDEPTTIPEIQDEPASENTRKTRKK